MIAVVAGHSVGRFVGSLSLSLRLFQEIAPWKIETKEDKKGKDLADPAAGY